MTAMRVFKPESEAETQSVVRDAAASSSPLAVEGNGTKHGLGREVAAGGVLKLSALAGITMYEPDEMVFSARAGTPLEEIEAALSAHGQCLCFEPGDCGPLWGSARGRSTLGGAVAAGMAGPRRFAAGAARDHLLGLVAINGTGERFKAGGRVVKNVTGYDLPKLAAGSFGTLFVMTELTLRAIPRGRASVVLALTGIEPPAALSMLRAIAASPFDPSGLAYLPATVATRIHEQPLVLIRFDGHPDGVKARAAELSDTLARGAKPLDPQHGAALFRMLADVYPLLAKEGAVWRLSLPPSRAMAAIETLAPSSWYADCAGGLLWCELPPARSNVHETVAKLGGHAMRYRASPGHSDRDVFPPLDEPTLALTRRLKHAFDPAGILNPGRMYKDI